MELLPTFTHVQGTAIPPDTPLRVITVNSAAQPS
jgi:hypothetical protein